MVGTMMLSPRAAWTKFTLQSYQML
jgi:hypothetical protein